MIKRILTALAIAAAVTTTAATAQAGKLENAVYKAVVEQKQTKKVRASGGHHFNIKPVSVTRTASGYLAKGQLSHHLRWRKDDQFFYTVHINRDGTIKKMEEKINRGGLTSTLMELPVGELIKAKSKGKVDAKTAKTGIEKAGRWLGKQLDGSWEGSARKIVVMIGLQIAQERRLHPGF